VYLCFVLYAVHYNLQSMALFIIVVTLEKNRAYKWFFECNGYCRFILLLPMMGSSFQLDKNRISQKNWYLSGRKMVKIMLVVNPVILSCLNPRMWVYYYRVTAVIASATILILAFCIRFCFIIKTIGNHFK